MLCRWASSFRRFERTQSSSPSKLPYCSSHKFQSTRYVARHVYVPSASGRHKSQALSRLVWRVAGLTIGRGKLSYLEETKQIRRKETVMELQ